MEAVDPCVVLFQRTLMFAYGTAVVFTVLVVLGLLAGA